MSAVIPVGADCVLENCRPQGVGEDVFRTHHWMYLASIPGEVAGF